MKNILFALALIASSPAFAAEPFADFAGNYRVSSTPQVGMGPGMKYCDYDGFRTLTGLLITPDHGGFYVGTIETLIDNSPVKFYTAFQTYAITQDGISNTATIAGDANGASYRMVDSSSGSMGVLEWSLTKSAAGYHFRITDQQTTPQYNSRCQYDVELARE